MKISLNKLPKDIQKVYDDPTKIARIHAVPASPRVVYVVVLKDGNKDIWRYNSAIKQWEYEVSYP